MKSVITSDKTDASDLVCKYMRERLFSRQYHISTTDREGEERCLLSAFIIIIIHHYQCQSQ